MTASPLDDLDASLAQFRASMDELLASDVALDPAAHSDEPVLAAWDDWECCPNPDHAGLDLEGKRAVHADDRLPDMRGSLLLGGFVAALFVGGLVLIWALRVWS